MLLINNMLFYISRLREQPIGFYRGRGWKIFLKLDSYPPSSSPPPPQVCFWGFVDICKRKWGEDKCKNKTFSSQSAALSLKQNSCMWKKVTPLFAQKGNFTTLKIYFISLISLQRDLFTFILNTNVLFWS